MKKTIFGLMAACALLTACEKDNTTTDVATHTRLLPLSGAYNVRDCGGYAAADGKTVKWRTVFRSGDLNKLTEGDLNYLNGIKYFVDFRGVTDGEATAAPDKHPASFVYGYSFPITAGNVLDMAQIASGSMTADEAMCELNRWLVTDKEIALTAYASFFGVLQRGGVPILFHCSAGKDRAGVAGALFLSSLGVDRQTIIDDYMLSAGYVAEKYADYVAQAPYLAGVFTTKPEFIQAAFDQIDESYGSMDNFLQNVLHVDLQKMRNLYTE